MRMADLPSIRSVMPWCYVGAAVLCSVVAVVLVPVANLGLMSGAVIGGAVAIVVGGALLLALRIRGALRRRRARDA
jgi:hypothetical protein